MRLMSGELLKRKYGRAFLAAHESRENNKKLSI